MRKVLCWLNRLFLIYKGKYRLWVIVWLWYLRWGSLVTWRVSVCIVTSNNWQGIEKICLFVSNLGVWFFVTLNGLRWSIAFHNIWDRFWERWYGNRRYFLLWLLHRSLERTSILNLLHYLNYENSLS